MIMNFAMKILGPILVLSSLLIGCQKEDVVFLPLDGDSIGLSVNDDLTDPINNELKIFEGPDTKVRVTPVWVTGDKIAVYSIDNDDVVIFIDTCEVFDVGMVDKHKDQGNYAKIVAEVAKECKGYFGAYPYDIFSYKVGDIIPFNEPDRNKGGVVDLSRVYLDGKFGNSSVMTSWCKWCDEKVKGHFDFRNRTAMLKLSGIEDGDLPLTIAVNDGISTIITEYTEEDLYYPIVTTPGKKNAIEVNYHGIYTSVFVPKDPYVIGDIYPFSVQKIRLTGLRIEGPEQMKPGTEGRIYCYGVMGGDPKCTIDLSKRCTWSINYTNRAVIEQTYDGLSGAWIKKEGAGNIIITATFEGFSTTFTIKHKG